MLYRHGHNYNCSNKYIFVGINFLQRNICDIYILFFSYFLGYKFAMLEMKSIISAVLRKCDLEPVLGKEKVIPRFRMTVRAHGGLWVKIRARNKRYESIN